MEIDGLASKWKALSGENNWKGLLDLMDDDLRRYLIYCGKMVGAIADGMNKEKESESYGLSLYPKKKLFSGVGLRRGNPFEYVVTKYIYLMSDQFNVLEKTRYNKKSTWIGYVAVSTVEGKMKLGRRDILVCWGGTNTDPEWLRNIQIGKSSTADILGKANNPVVHSAFYDGYTAKDAYSKFSKSSAREQVLSEIKILVSKYAEEEEVSITVAGHSFGAALATLSAMDIVFNGYNKPTNSSTGFPVTAFAYASPAIGNEGFQKVFNDLRNLHLLRIKDANDLIPIIMDGYKHVGIELKIKSSKSPELGNLSLSDVHDLNVYLHGIAGYHGRKRKFKLVLDLDLKLPVVNKDTSGIQVDREHGTPDRMNKDEIIQLMDVYDKLKGSYVPDSPGSSGTSHPIVTRKENFISKQKVNIIIPETPAEKKAPLTTIRRIATATRKLIDIAIFISKEGLGMGE